MEETTTGINEEYTEEQEEVVEEGDQEEVVQEEVQQADYSQIYSEQLELTNHLISGQIFFMGLIFGAIIFKIFWDRWRI